MDPLGGVDPLGGRGPPMQALFSENLCENKESGPVGGGVSPARPPPLDPPMPWDPRTSEVLSSG